MKNQLLFLSILLSLSVGLLMTGCQKDDDGTGDNPEVPNDYFKLSDSKCVEVASANLFWDGTRFRFESNAYDFAKTWDDQHVSHFYWTKNLHQTYVRDYNEYDEAQITDTSCWDERLKDSRIVDGDTGWYIPSAEEWDYLVTHHTYLYCCVLKAPGDTVFGLMILPYGSTQFVLQGNMTAPSLRTTYLLNLTDYEANLQRHAVFLPGANYRDGSRIDASYNGCYLTSTPMQSMTNAAECLNFYEYGISAWFILGRSFAGTIRLVRNL